MVKVQYQANMILDLSNELNTYVLDLYIAMYI